MAPLVTPETITETPARPPRLHIERADIIWAAALFAVLLLAKWLIIVVPYEGISIVDERTYYAAARALASLELPATAQYPPLYPLLLAPAFWFVGGSLTAIVALGVIYSALSVIPVYAFARLIMPRMYAGMAALATCLLPWHYILPRTMVSENIYIGLILLAGLMGIWAPRRGRWWWDAGFGLMLGMMYLTRYISLVLIPALLIVWWLREWGQQAGEGDVHPAWERFGRFGLVLAVVAASYGWWVVGQAAMPQTTASDALGFVITSRTDPAAHTLDRLWLYVRWYGAYFLLLAVPVMGLVLQSLRQGATEWLVARYPTLYARAVSFAVLIGGALFVAVSRHSWRANYNYPDPVRIMGRYLVVVGPILLILGFAALWLLAEHPFRTRLSAAVWMLGVPGLLTYVAHKVVIGDWLIPFRIEQLTDRGSVDGFAVNLMGEAFWPLAALSLFTAAAIVMWRPAWRWAPVVLLGVVALQLAWPAPVYISHVNGYQDAASHGARITRAIADLEPPGPPDVIVGVSEQVSDAARLRQLLGRPPGLAGFSRTVEMNMQIRGRGARVIPHPPVWDHGEPLEIDYVLMTAAEVEPDAEVIETWVRGGETFVLIEAPDPAR